MDWQSGRLAVMAMSKIESSAPHRADILAGDGILRQDQQAVDIGARVQVIVQTQLFARAQHAVGLKALPHPLFDVDAAGQRGAVQGGGHMGAHKDIGGRRW